jgi:hypothetical protein
MAPVMKKKKKKSQNAANNSVRDLFSLTQRGDSDKDKSVIF